MSTDKLSTSGVEISSVGFPQEKPCRYSTEPVYKSFANCNLYLLRRESRCWTVGASQAPDHAPSITILVPYLDLFGSNCISY
ncbi:unnamed protein product [Urochloa humidicola]